MLQDFALTNKLLRVVNSVAFQGSGRITKVSEAIMKLGLDQMRAIATGLMLATLPPTRTLHPVFPEVILGTFISAVVGRNIGHLADLPNPEEVFICSMFGRLGEILTIYYFPEEYDEIVNNVRTRMTNELCASRTVLGIGFDVLGVEVARRWNFPPNLLYAMRALPEGILAAAATERERIAHCAGFARELCDAAWRAPDSQREWALSSLTERYQATVPRAPKYIRAVIRHALELGQKYCHALNIDPTGSALIEGLAKWGYE